MIKLEVLSRGEWLDADRRRPFIYQDAEEAIREMGRQVASHDSTMRVTVNGKVVASAAP